MVRRRHLFLAVAGVAATAALLGGVLAGNPAAGPASNVSPAAAAATLAQGFSPGDTAAYVAQLERRVEQDPTDAEGLTLLGLAYQQRVRETGDPSFYTRSAEALRRSLELVPDNDLALTGLAALAASRHRFRDAGRLARRALAANPYSASALGTLGDAKVELGDYEGAFATFDRMAALKPTVGSYARVVLRARAPRRTGGAVEAMKLAVSAAAGRPSRPPGRSSSSATFTTTAGDCAPPSARIARRSPAFRITTAPRPRSPASRRRTARSTTPSRSTGARSKPSRFPNTPPASARPLPPPAAGRKQTRRTSSSTSSSGSSRPTAPAPSSRRRSSTSTGDGSSPTR